MMRPRWTASVAALVCAACSGSNTSGGTATSVAKSPLARDTSPTVSTADQSGIEAANEAFAFTMLGAADASTNVVLSPYSLSSALAMAYAGARGETADQMALVLGFTSVDPSTAASQARVPPAFDWLDLQLASRGTTTTPFTLHVANSVWVQSGYAVERPFLDTLATNFGAGVEVTDFSGDPEASRQAINGWVSDQTDGKIAELVPAPADPRIVLALLDAITFDAQWATPFSASDTSTGAFTRSDGTTVQPPMMHATGDFGYAATGGFQLVELPYAGGNVAFDLVVPTPGTSPSAMTASVFGTLVNTVVTSSVAVTLPKLQIHGATIDVGPELAALGMTDAFTSSADFGGISASRDLFIAHVFHQAFVAVDEQGTQAAAASAVEFARHGATGSSAAQVAADHPFAFVIRDLPTNTILFVGEVFDPTS